MLKRPPPPNRPSSGRFAEVSHRKANGATYTPPDIAAYLARQLVNAAGHIVHQKVIRVLDPAIGDGVLAVALLRELARVSSARISLFAYETNPAAAAQAKLALESVSTEPEVQILEDDFLADVSSTSFDMVIANPPYVRTQILGAQGAGRLAKRFGLEGRLDLYQAFTLAVIDRLVEGGALALITSNRFFTTKGARAFRDAVHDRMSISRVWDLGDTKIFDAAVLPAMLVGLRRYCTAVDARQAAAFTSVYEQPDGQGAISASLVQAIELQGDVRIGKRQFNVQQGHLWVRRRDIWRLSSASRDAWLETVKSNTWKRLGDIGKIRVGVKTTADRVFIRDDWAILGAEAPELLRPLITHHVAERYRGREPIKLILYPHSDVGGRREVADLSKYPRAAAYLETHRKTLEAREYAIKAGRKWYELWVPQEPVLWSRPKLVFRDIAEKPTFFVSLSGSIVNGDCYWLVTKDSADEELLWLAVAVANSTFTETFYDHCFNNKLYAGRRRFMSQYVEQFPLPSPTGENGCKLIALAKRRYESLERDEHNQIEHAIDALVWESFGVSPVLPSP